MKEQSRELECHRCGYVWKPRLSETPGVCPTCKRTNWAVEGPTPFEVRRDRRKAEKLSRAAVWKARKAKWEKTREERAVRRLERSRTLTAKRAERETKCVQKCGRKPKKLPVSLGALVKAVGGNE